MADNEIHFSLFHKGSHFSKAVFQKEKKKRTILTMQLSRFYNNAPKKALINAECTVGSPVVSII